VIGTFQARLLMTVFYLLIVVPVGLIMRAWSDPLRLRRTTQASYWNTRTVVDETLASAAREF
jgi:hypothetical protein